MAMYSPHPLVSLPTASSPRAALRSSACFLPSISCSSKRKKKASAKPKVLSPPKSPKTNFPQNDELLPGIGGGAFTLTALQPLVDEEDTLVQQKQKLERQLAQHRLNHRPPSNCSTEQDTDPISRFTLAAYDTSEVMNFQPEDCEDDLETDTESNNYDAPILYDDAALELGNEDDVEEKGEDNLDDAFEWVEINAEDADEEDDIGDGDGHYAYWEGDLPPMSKEEEAKVLLRARRELAILENKKKSLIMRSDHFEEKNEEDELEDLSSDESDIDEEEEFFMEADAALAKFEATAMKRSVVTKDRMAGGLEAKFHGPLKSDDDDNENVAISGKDEFTLASIKSLKGSRKQKIIDDEDDDEERIEEKRQPKRGIPAVMRSFDRAKIYVKAGNGGNGVVAFRREKYVPFGGPSGGSGGRGGHVYVRAAPSLNSLLCFRRSVHFRAGRGSHGMGKSQEGAAGVDCIIDVPLGTVIREANDGVSGLGKILLEVIRPGQCELLLEGGRGGRGNVAFKTGRNKTPQLAENGEEGAELWLELELKLVADVGIIGVPNAGKSTLLSVISAAQPAIGAYPFTTLLPNLGVVPIGFESTMVVADLPGLLEGAHLGVGLGHEFLRHTERCRVLVHMVDGMSQQPEQEYEAVRLELQLFNPLLSEKPYIVAFNKMDIPEAAERWPSFQDYLRQKGVEPICISAATKTGVKDVVNRAYSLLQSLPNHTYEATAERESRGSDEIGIAEVIKRQRSAPIEEFEIIEDKASKTWRVQGVGLERFVQMTNWEYFEALTRFQHVLSASGVNKALKDRGVVEGDVVIVGEMDFIWQDTEDIRSIEWKRSFRGSRLWPH